MSKRDPKDTSNEVTPLIRIDEGITSSGDNAFDVWLREEFVDHADIPDEYKVIMRVAWDAGMAYLRTSETCPACGESKAKTAKNPQDPLSEWEYDEVSAEEWDQYSATPPPPDED